MNNYISRKGYIVFLFCVIFSICFLLSCYRGNSSTKMVAGVSCEAPYVDFGSIDKKTTDSVPFVFELKNITGDTICISSVELGCNCVIIESYPLYLSPKGCDSIQGYIDITGQHGNLSKPIYVNIGKDELMILRIKGNVM